MASRPLEIAILGGGVAGLATALALSRFAPNNAVPRISIYEIRKEPGTIGGAVNLTPNALRLLDYLGVYQVIRNKRYGVDVDAVEIFDLDGGSKLGESAFRGPHNQGLGTPPYKVSISIMNMSTGRDLICLRTGNPCHSW